jgi:hypothetical protein
MRLTDEALKTLRDDFKLSGSFAWTGWPLVAYIRCGFHCYDIQRLASKPSPHNLINILRCGKRLLKTFSFKFLLHVLLGLFTSLAKIYVDMGEGCNGMSVLYDR